MRQGVVIKRYEGTPEGGPRCLPCLRTSCWTRWTRSWSEEATASADMLLAGGRLTIAPESLKRVKDRIREITRRKRGVSLEWMISELNSHLSGWVTYFRYASAKAHLQRLDEWIRRKRSRKGWWC